MDNDTLAKLLTEIRDGNQQLLEEYRRLASESLAIQKQALAHQQDAIERQKLAVEAQLKHVRLYRRIIFFTIPLIVFLLWALVRMLRRV